MVLVSELLYLLCAGYDLSWRPRPLVGSPGEGLSLMRCLLSISTSFVFYAFRSPFWNHAEFFVFHCLLGFFSHEVSGFSGVDEFVQNLGFPVTGTVRPLHAFP